MFGLLPIEGSWFLRFEKLLEESFRKSPRPSLPLKRGIFQKPTLNGLYTPFGSPYRRQKNSGERGCNCPTVLNFLPLRLSCKESSTSNQAFLLRRKDVTALRCSEPLRYKVGGASKPSPCCAGWDRRGNSSLQLIVYSFLIFVVIC